MNCSFLQLQPRRLLNVCVALPPLSTPPYIKGPTKWSFPVTVMMSCSRFPSVSQSRLITWGGHGGGFAICNAWRPASLPALHMSLCAPVFWRVLDVSAAAAVWSGGILLCGCAARCGVVWDIWPRPSACQQIFFLLLFTISPPLFQKCLPVLLCIEKKKSPKNMC